MVEEVAESWEEEAADSEVNNERLIIPSVFFTWLFIEVPVTPFYVNSSHGPTM